MHFTEAMEQVARGFEIVGALVLVLGLAWSAVLAARVWRRSGNGSTAYQALRRELPPHDGMSPHQEEGRFSPFILR